jgi:hypothetical protein
VDLQRPHREVSAAIQRLNLPPAMELNGVPYYDAQAIEQLYSALKNAGGKGNR